MNLWKLSAVASLALALVSGTAAAEAPAPAKKGLDFGKHNSNAPINVSSDSFIGDFTTKVGTYTGNVIVTQADYKLRADRVKVEVVEGKPNKFEAEGKVIFDSPSGTATGDNGVYDLTPRTVTLTGNVVLTKQKDVLRGTILVVNLDTGEARMTAQGMPGRRVQGLFTPNSQPQTNKTSQTPHK